ncbi:PREDICTED: FACT complex subunit SSRP1-like [Priapulus caudatus]|uniref:FACT complex subunit SSRP1 n=1 Tax=Priapulus caudatus TaxID=37621 RepID=A0ABM1EPZ2_PRICU|nr:PREDICTED: FACT complex subunit SSRP1-like [Priapulus caudatus]
MIDGAIEFGDVSHESAGLWHQGKLRMLKGQVVFKTIKTGKVEHFEGEEIEDARWQRLSSGYLLRIMLKSGTLHRFRGFRDGDQEKLVKCIKENFDIEVEESEVSIRGWNWGSAEFNGSVLSFDVHNKTAFELPLNNVSRSMTGKNEVTIEFHQNDDDLVALTELRFHIPPSNDPETDAVKTFYDSIMAKASVIQATGDAIVTFKEVQCLTPRGRYDIKIFATFLQLHGKTFDYKIPLSTVLRLFLLPHKDQRQMFFVVSLDPPIKQGQTRYHFMILQFNREDEETLELTISEEEIKEKYDGKLSQEMSGPTYEIVSRVMKALVQRKITVPGSFTGHSGAHAISCSYKATAGFLYPLERGFIYVHKPPVHIRFDEISFTNFARSGGSTRSFDFEIETKNGTLFTYSSIDKEEYANLFDFVKSKKLRIKNRGDKLPEPGMEKSRSRRSKKVKDPNAPKRPQSAYFIWLNENRERIKTENPGISITDISKKAGEGWKLVTDKTEWDEKAVQAKKKYEEVMREYEKTKKPDDGPSPPKKSAGKGKASKSPAKSPAKEGHFKSKEYITSSESGSSSESDDDKPLKPKPKPKAKPKAKAKKKKESEDEEEVVSTPPSSDADSD